MSADDTDDLRSDTDDRRPSSYQRHVTAIRRRQVDHAVDRLDAVETGDGISGRQRAVIESLADAIVSEIAPMVGVLEAKRVRQDS